jgi:hypothetical protein
LIQGIPKERKMEKKNELQKLKGREKDKRKNLLKIFVGFMQLTRFAEGWVLKPILSISYIIVQS